MIYCFFFWLFVYDKTIQLFFFWNGIIMPSCIFKMYFSEFFLENNLTVQFYYSTVKMMSGTYSNFMCHIYSSLNMLLINLFLCQYFYNLDFLAWNWIEKFENFFHVSRSINILLINFSGENGFFGFSNLKLDWKTWEVSLMYGN